MGVSSIDLFLMTVTELVKKSIHAVLNGEL